MDRQTLEDHHMVARYLAGQLDAAESAAFEAHYAQNPDTVREIERTLRFKEALAVLNERGELDALVRARHYAWRPVVGLAAGIAVLAVGVWLWLAQTTVSPIVSTIAALSDEQGQTLQVASAHMLVRTRGPASVIEIPLPAERSAIELRMIPSSRPADAGFRVLLGQLDAANAVAPVAETRAAASSADGFVTAWLDSAKLSRGRYVIELLPERSTAPGTPGDRFVVELR
jgi:hypothetical protein